jgi:glycine/D-amino acid oxidase-like deaminating enzyme
LRSEPNIQWGGSVAWFPPGREVDELRANVRSQQEWGYAVRLISGTHALLPNVSATEIGAACFSEQEGAVDPLEALTALLANARRFGAEGRFPCQVTGIRPAGSRMQSIQTTDGQLAADVLVLAPGVHFKQALDGRIVAGGPIVAGVGTAVTEASVDQAEEIRRNIARFLPQTQDFPVERVTLGYRVMPEDEYPILGFAQACPNLYVCRHA